MEYLQLLRNIILGVIGLYLFCVIASAIESIYNNLRYHDEKLTEILSRSKIKLYIILSIVSVIALVIGVYATVVDYIPEGNYQVLAEISYDETANQFEKRPVDLEIYYDEDIHKSYYFVNGEEQEHVSSYVVYRLDYMYVGDSKISFDYDDAFAFPNIAAKVYLLDDETETPIYVNIGEISPKTLGISLNDRWSSLGLFYKIFIILALCSVIYNATSTFMLVKRNNNLIQEQQKKLKKGELTEKEKQEMYERLQKKYINFHWLKSLVSGIITVLFFAAGLAIAIILAKAMNGVGNGWKWLIGFVVFIAVYGGLMLLAFKLEIFDNVDLYFNKLQDRKNEKIFSKNKFYRYEVFGLEEGNDPRSEYQPYRFYY